MNDVIFRQYDIRGVVGQDFRPEDFVDLGRALGALFRERGQEEAVVGRDNRASSPALAEALSEGLRSVGVSVADIGMVTTPMFYFARLHLGLPAGAMVTASHNPPEHNGLKVGLGEGTWYGEEILAVRDRLAGPFPTGRGGRREVDVREAYITDLLHRITLPDRAPRLVVDSGNGTAGPIAAEVLRRLGVPFVSICEEPDARYPYHHPDPTVAENLRLLVSEVKRQGADLGIAFDGDGDRLGVVDERGAIVPADRFMLLFWEEILARHPGAEALVEVKCSQVLFDAIEALGGRPRFCRTGHSLIKAEMRAHDLVFAGEMSGHLFFRDEHPGYDDGLYGALRLLRILARADAPLSRLLDRWPTPAATPELRVFCPDEAKALVVDAVRQRLSERHPAVAVDGVRALFPAGWGLVRLSNTQPALIVRAEGAGERDLAAILAELKDVLAEAYQRFALDPAPLAELGGGA